MTRITFLTFIGVLFQFAVFAQSCLPEGITFTTQLQIINFQTNYPGCTVIEGDVTISGDFITNLNGLSILTEIGGDLNIMYNDNLTSLTGLNGIGNVGGGVWINENEELTSLSGLNSLTHIGAGLNIYNNSSLINLTGIENLEIIDDFLNVCDNDLIENLNGFNSLTTIQGYLAICANNSLTDLSGMNSLNYVGNGSGGLFIDDNPNLISLAGMPNLTAIGGQLYLAYNPELIGLSGLSNLTEIDGDLWIAGNSLIEDFSGLDALTFVNGIVRIVENNNLLNLNGLNNINPNSITSLEIHDNISLSICAIESVCNYLLNPIGTVDIFNNAPGCNSETEIITICNGPVGCLPEGIDFYNQEQIDNFPQNYPGCTQIEGDVIIDGQDIVNLDSLIVLTAIGGNLKVIMTSTLADFTGLDSLKIIYGSLLIGDGLNGGNEGLLNLHGLENLKYVGGHLKILDNNALISTEGLDNLDTIQGDFNFSDNTALTVLSGFNNLKFVGGALSLFHNFSMLNISGLNSLTTISGDLYFLSNFDLQSISGMSGLSSIEGGLIFRFNQSLNDLTGLEELTYLGGQLTLYKCNNLSSIAALSGLTTLHDFLIIDGSDSLKTLTGLENITSIAGWLSVWSCPLLTDISEFSELTSIGNGLTIYNNESLLSLNGLSAVTSFSGGLEVSTNIGLTSLSGIDNIPPSSISSINITNNINLSTCEVESICAYLADTNAIVSIYNNAPGCNSRAEVEEACDGSNSCLPEGIVFVNQEQIDQFQVNYPGCSHIAGSVGINGDGQVLNLEGLSVLLAIGGNLEIYGNYNLLNLDGLENIAHNTIQGIYIFNNPSLSLCSVQSICEFLLYSGGTAEIHDNAPGCNSPEEVQEICMVEIFDKSYMEDEILIFPNPVNKSFMIQSPLDMKINEVSIFNFLGQKVLYVKDLTQKIDISLLQKGMYLVEMGSDNAKFLKKLIIQ